MRSVQGAAVPVSVPDTSPIIEGSTPRPTLRNTVDLALVADTLGIAAGGGRAGRYARRAARLESRSPPAHTWPLTSS
jgi:hypothetical protein